MGANRNVGEVEVTIGTNTYVARFGNRELARLEKLWGVRGIGDIYTRGVHTSNQCFIEFARMGLSRHQPEMSEDQVADLLDYRDDDDERPMLQTVIRAFEATIPKAMTSASTKTNEAQSILTTAPLASA
jgi:hypothetical protein